MTSYIVYLSGENLDLAKAELEALAQQYPKKLEIKWWERIVKIDAEDSPVDYFLDRAALVKKAGVLLGEFAHNESLLAYVPDDLWMKIIGPSDSYSVRTDCIGIKYDLKRRAEIERDLGTHVRKITRARVELKTPKKQILVIITPERVLLTILTESKLRKLLRSREPGRKPFFHPSMMNSTLSRVMCNLAGVKPRDIILDPFCGGGGILCEAAYIGASVIGIDLNWRLLRGAAENLGDITTKFSLLQADALQNPIQNVDHIVTDPPYGRSSSTRGYESKKMIESFLKKVPCILQSDGANLCLCGSTELGLLDMIQEIGLRVGYNIRIRVHAGLVREVVTVRF